MGNEVKDFFDKLTPEKLQPEGLKPDKGPKSDASSPTVSTDTGTLDDETATEIAKSTAFRRNLFLSPTAFARGTLSTTGRSRLTV